MSSSTWFGLVRPGSIWLVDSDHSRRVLLGDLGNVDTQNSILVRTRQLIHIRVLRKGKRAMEGTILLLCVAVSLSFLLITLRHLMLALPLNHELMIVNKHANILLLHSWEVDCQLIGVSTLLHVYMSHSSKLRKHIIGGEEGESIPREGTRLLGVAATVSREHHHRNQTVVEEIHMIVERKAHFQKVLSDKSRY